MGILTFILFLIVAAVCAWIGEMLVPGVIPGGFLAAAIVGIIGAWIGSTIMGGFGPSLFGVPLLPTIIGSALLVLIFHVVSRLFWYRRDVV